MTRIKNTEQFKNKVAELVNDEYEVLGEYVSTRAKVKMKHLICNHIYDVSPHDFCTRNRRCPKCFGNNKKSQKEWEDEVKLLSNGEYVSLDKYCNNRIKIEMLHIVCGRSWLISPSNFIKGHRCPDCATKNVAKKLSLSNDEYVKRFYSVVNKEEYSLLSDYKDIATKIKIQHNVCGNIFNMLPNNFLIAGQRCPNCKVSSKGEKYIKQWLDSHSINYKKEFSFADLRGKKNKPLRYDFAILDNDNKLILLIEYDGKQHYKYENSSLWHKGNSYEDIKHRDELKTNYCIKNNIKLIRISYRRYKNLDKILSSTILEKGSETI